MAPAALAVPAGSLVSPLLARIEINNDVCVAYDRNVFVVIGVPQGAAPVTECGSARIPVAESCLTSKAPVHGRVDS